MQLSEAARVLGGALHGADVPFAGCTTDSRTLGPGSLFVALRGPSFDGHDFVDHARTRGAAGAVVSDARGFGLPTVTVADTLDGLGRLAAAWRSRFAMPVVAITGSNGKTTVKEMIAAILGRGGPVLATRGNLNNEIGVPLTLMSLDGSHHRAVIELGANHAGEIARLTRMVRPQVGVITQCAPAHLEGFGSIEGVARAKGELFETMPEAGACVINADDDRAPLWRVLAGTRRRLEFGSAARADVRGTPCPGDGVTRLEMDTPIGPLTVKLSLPGRHNALNALAATAAAVALGVDGEDIVGGLESVRPVAGRLEARQATGGARLIDDTYNANPASLDAALDVLGDVPGRRWLALGDMAELGEDAGRWHARAGEAARARGVERLWATGELSRAAVDAFGAGATHFDDVTALGDALRAALTADVTVLVKGSRSMRMERIVAALARGRT